MMPRKGSGSRLGPALATLAAVGAVTMLTAGAAAPPSRPLTVTLQPESKVRVEGGSTLRDWSCDAKSVTGAIRMDDFTGELLPNVGAARAGEVEIAVAAIDCGNGTMNGHMRKALEAQQHPAIRFTLTGAEIAQAAGDAAVVLTGTLEIAGQRNAVELEATAATLPDGGIRLEGREPIRMTTYGVQPPSLMLGTLKVRDEVVVSYDVVVRP